MDEIFLDGMHETIKYKNPRLGFRRYYNNETTDFADHWHTSVEIIVPICNGYSVTVGGKTQDLNVDDIIIINSGVIHSLTSRSEGERIIWQFDSALLYSIQGMETLLFDLQPVVFLPRGDDEVYKSVYERLSRIVTEYDGDKPHREAMILANVIEMFVEISRCGRFLSNVAQPGHQEKKQSYMECITKTCAYINTHFTESLSLEKVAMISGFSKYHFTRLFKEYMNMTYYDYLNEQRVKRAEELLYKGEMSITDIAMNSGFSSLSAFNRTFKAVKGCAPSEFRKPYAKGKTTHAPVQH